MLELHAGITDFTAPTLRRTPDVFPTPNLLRKQTPCPSCECRGSAAGEAFQLGAAKFSQMKPPACQFYFADFFMGTATMTAEEVGGYMRLLCYAWDRGGLPDDDTQLAKMAGVSPESLNQIRCKFVRYQDGLIRNERMELERRKQAEYRAAQSHNGAKGAAKRWHSDGIAVPSPKNSDPMISPMAKNSSPSPSPSPSLISEFKQDTQKGAKAPRVFVKPTPGDVSSYSLEIGYPLNGEAWCDSYAQKGWLVGKNKMKDWKAAVRNWKANGWKPDRNGQHQNQLPMDPEAQRRLDAF